MIDAALDLLLIGLVLLCCLIVVAPVALVLFPAQHYIDGEPTPRHRASCRRCRKAAGSGSSGGSDV